MNQRDTVLVAVFVNIGLVVVLFLFGLKPSSPVELAKISEPKGKIEAAVPKLQPKQAEESSTSIDQVDQILSKYLQQEEKKSDLIEAKPFVEVMPLQKIQPKLAAPSEKVKEVIVRQGDVLEKIAKIHKTSVEEIMRLNGLTTTKLQIGQILLIPSETTVAAITSVAKIGSDPVKEAKYYVVKNGENPWTIAIKNKIRVEELLRLNNLDEAKAKRLKPGDRLRVQ